MVERIRLPDREERVAALEEAGYNVFNLPSEKVFIDLLTDSGTNTMSQEQWAALITGDEAYAGSKSFNRLQRTVEEVLGFERIIPVHQGRGAENVLYGAVAEEGDVVPNNTHFDTTRAHIANQDAEPVDCPVAGAMELQTKNPFKGDISLETVQAVAEEHGAENVPAIVLTLTNNSMAGQPVSMANTEAARKMADELDALLIIDACRFAENAFFIQQREEGYGEKPVRDIAREQLSHADAVVMSGKKDGIANIGGFVAVRDRKLYERCRQRGILYEGFTTYGGMAGRDLAAMAVGLQEAVEQDYIEARVGQVVRLGAMLDERDVPVYLPTGGHAVYIDAEAMLPHIPREQFPGQALVCALYQEGGIRGVELGNYAFPGADRPVFVRLALPRRMYHDEHLQHIAETFDRVQENTDQVDGLEIVEQPEREELRHFSATLQPVT